MTNPLPHPTLQGGRHLGGEGILPTRPKGAPRRAAKRGSLEGRRLALRHAARCATLLLPLFLTACLSQTPATRPETEPTLSTQLPDGPPPSPPPGLDRQPNPTVTHEPALPSKSRPYEVFGERYEVLETSDGYMEEGLASWYGTRFDGLATATGETYDVYELTAAHRSLPLPCWARVTNLANGKSTIVRVNDRGPFHPDRIIDLSYAAAVKLGFAEAGTAQVRVETVTPADFLPRPPPRYFVEAGPFLDFAAAAGSADQIAAIANAKAMVARSQNAFLVRIGPLTTRSEAERLKMVVAFGQEWSPNVIEQ